MEKQMSLVKIIKDMYEMINGKYSKRHYLKIDFISLSMNLTALYKLSSICKTDSSGYKDTLTGFKQGLDRLENIYHNPLFERTYFETQVLRYYQQLYRELLSPVHKADSAYKILGLQENASNDEIKRAYRRLAKEYHPDKNFGDKEAEENFKQIKDAYEILQKVHGEKR